jgi:hypothetical protein
LEAADVFAFGIFDNEGGVVGGPVDKLPKAVFAGAGTEEHGVDGVGLSGGLNFVIVECVDEIAVFPGRQVVANEDAEIPIEHVL